MQRRHYLLYKANFYTYLKIYCIFKYFVDFAIIWPLNRDKSILLGWGRSSIFYF